MGYIEDKSKKNKKRKNIQRAVLSTIAVSGLLAVSMVAPNTVKVLKSLGFHPNKREDEVIKRARKRLIDKGFVIYNNSFLKITENGKKELNRFSINNWVINKPRKWDGRWRMLIFDIPEHRRSTRDKVRATLSSIGFIKVQQSVWIYPYDCGDLITLLKADFKIGKDLLYLIVDSMENDNKFKKLFELV